MLRKYGTGSIRYLGSAILNYLNVFRFTKKTRKNRGNRNRKVDLCIKGCLGSKESASIIEIPRYINTV